MTDEIQRDEHGFGNVNQGYAAARAAATDARPANTRVEETEELVDHGRTLKSLSDLLTQYVDESDLYVRCSAGAWEIRLATPDCDVIGHGRRLVDALDDVIAKAVR